MLDYFIMFLLKSLGPIAPLNTFDQLNPCHKQGTVALSAHVNVLS